MTDCDTCPRNMGKAGEGATWCAYGAPRNKPTQWHMISEAQRLSGCPWEERDEIR